MKRLTGPGIADLARRLIGGGGLRRRVAWWLRELISLCAWLAFLVMITGVVNLALSGMYRYLALAIAGVGSTLLVGADIAARWRRWHDRAPEIAELERGEADADFR